MTTTKISDEEALARLDAIDPSTALVRDGAPIRDLSAAVDRRDAAQRQIDQLVLDARAAGHTWVSIGASLGVSPQAARQRYSTSSTLSDLGTARRAKRRAADPASVTGP